ncbi:MAG: proprotein convertase P-domain-containing protein, partial [Verrucomicrobiales bacterium]|nr:proprotein convertase P-domain-containing protein [Verrucomicrobiales bacterium]
LAAGIGALTLQANPNLSWRDVKEILLRSSTKLSPTSSGWVSRTGGQPELPVIKHHHNFGGGMINAQAAVSMAQTWQSLPAATSHEILNNTPTDIPDGRSNVTEVFDFSTMTAMRVEHVEVKVDIDHDYRGDLDISLVSPSGVISQLATRSPFDGGGLDFFGDYLGEGYIDWTFTSVRHWGESSNGQWKVIIRDLAARDTGIVYSVRVRLHGITAPAVEFAVNGQPEGLLVPEGSAAQFMSTTTGYPTINHQWRKNGVNIARATDSTYSFAAASLKQVGRYADRVTNLTGLATSVEVPLGVVRVTNDAPTFNEGTTLNLVTTAASGVALSYQWKLGGIDLVDDGRISGATTAKLSIKATTFADEGDYECIVSDGTRMLSAGTRAVQIRLKPVVQGMSIADAAVSQLSTISIIVDNGATTFTSTRLPKGMRLNRKTGVISGRPLLPGNYTFTVYASNAAGKSPGQTFTWNVEALDEDVRGSFQGLVDRDMGLNTNFGGSLKARVTDSGTYTGSLLLGAKRYSFRGMLDTAPSTDPVGTSTIVRRGMSSLVVAFSISNATGEITGTVTDGIDTAALLARRNPWNARLFSAEAFAGYYTFAMDLGSHIGDAGVPQGTGYGTATVTTAGTIRWSGRLPDGTSFSGTSTFDIDGRWSGFNLLYSATGSLLGWRDMDLGAANNFVLNSMTGSLSWLRNVQAASQRLYQAGFGPVTLDVHGGKYVKPATGVIVVGLEDPTTFVDGKNAQLDFVNGGIESASLYAGLHPGPFTITTKNTTVVPKAGTAENIASLRVSVNASTGLVSGSFLLADANPAVPTTTIKRTVGYLGVLLPQEGMGKGYFLLPSLPEASPAPIVAPAKTPILGGGFILNAPPH